MKFLRLLISLIGDRIRVINSIPKKGLRHYLKVEEEGVIREIITDESLLSIKGCIEYTILGVGYNGEPLSQKLHRDCFELLL